jgi:hypothetical protein
MGTETKLKQKQPGFYINSKCRTFQRGSNYNEVVKFVAGVVGKKYEEVLNFENDKIVTTRKYVICIKQVR